MDKEDLYYAAYGAFTTLANPNEPSELKQEANELLIEYSKENKEFKNQAEKAYKDVIKKIISDSRIKDEKERIESLQEVNKIGAKIGFTEKLSEEKIKSTIRIEIEKAKLESNRAGVSPNKQADIDKQYKYNQNIIDEFDEISSSSSNKKERSNCCCLIA